MTQQRGLSWIVSSVESGQEHKICSHGSVYRFFVLQIPIFGEKTVASTCSDDKPMALMSMQILEGSPSVEEDLFYTRTSFCPSEKKDKGRVVLHVLLKFCNLKIVNTPKPDTS